jgi:hypothetical protein
VVVRLRSTRHSLALEHSRLVAWELSRVTHRASGFAGECENRVVDNVRAADSAAVDSRAVVLVEGISDQIAVETLAARLGRNLRSEGVSVVPMGGVQAIGRFLTRFGPRGAKLRLAGLYDLGEERVVQRAFQRAGFGSGFPLARAALEELGFYVCVVDLEDELIRALGATSVVAVIHSQGDLGSFRTLQNEPAWRGQSVEAQLRRFMGSGATRKIRYARLLADALDPAQAPRPLRFVLTRV